MHQVIKEYVETDRKISDILNDFGSIEQPVEVVFQLILKQINDNMNPPNETYEKIDEVIEKGHPDEEVFLLFISYLIIFYNVQKKQSKGESVYRISCSISITNYHPVIQAFYYYACSFYFFEINDFEKNDEMRSISLMKMPKDCPRYKIFLSNTCQMIGLLGRLQELPKEDLAMLEKLSQNDYGVLSALSNNSLFIGDLKLIDKCRTALRNKFKDHPNLNDNVGESMKNVLQGDLEEKKGVPADFNICLSYYKSLKRRDLETAKLIFGNINDKSLCSVFIFVNYHHAFLTGRYEIIEKVIKDRINQSNHYMLDFFLVRYFLIKNKKDLARFYYAQLLKNCEKYQAMGRLKFEMEFAFELSAASFFELTQPLQLTISDEKIKTLAAEHIAPELVSLGFNRIVGKSNIIIDIKKKVKSFANIQRPILVIGETGAGKEVVARAIHEESTHQDNPFLPINCGALTDTLLQSELFGYEVGAFTGAVSSHKGIFEAAEEGTVFLDEFGEMSHKLQVSLLRVLENNEVMRVGGTKPRKIKCHIIAATNANIEDLISKKLFREDLYHRLKQFAINIPPLRERKEDIPELINFFLNQQNAEHLQALSKELLVKFIDYDWPGNIRELKNEIDRIKILCGYKPIIEENDIEIEWLKKKTPKIAINPNFETLSPNATKDEQMHQRLLNRKLTSGDKRRQQILQLFHQYKQLTRSQITDALEICSLTATKDLQQLCTQGLLVKIKPTRSPRSHYFEII